jgi:hypothetical protein
VVPMVETCARPALQPISIMAAMNSTRRMRLLPPPRPSLSAPCCAPRPWLPPRGSPSDSR